MRLLIICIFGLFVTNSCEDSLDCFKRGEKINEYIFDTKVPYGDQLTWRNDSLVISTDYSVNYDEKQLPYESYIQQNSKFISSERHFFIDISTGQLVDTLKKQYVPTFNRGKISAAFFSTDTNTIQKGNIVIHKYTLTHNYKGFQIYFEWWEPKVRCSGEHRIAIYKDNSNVKNYVLNYGINDYLIDGNNLIILTAYSEWPDWGGRHLQKISLDELVHEL